MSRPTHANPSHYFSPQPLKSGAISEQTFDISVSSITLSMSTDSGTFSKDKLDTGSELLLTTFVSRKANYNSICDLGCGWGAMGCFIAAHLPRATIHMCDINPRAVQLARQNAEQNDLLNTNVWCGEGLSAARSEYFDLVVCNPPIRAGNAVIQKLFEDAQRCLKAGGVLCVVIRTAQGAKSWQKKLSRQFGNCETIALESGYRILQSTK